MSLISSDESTISSQGSDDEMPPLEPANELASASPVAFQGRGFAIPRIMLINPNWVLGGSARDPARALPEINIEMLEPQHGPAGILSQLFRNLGTSEPETELAHDSDESVHRLIAWSGLILQKFLCHVRDTRPWQLAFYYELLVPLAVRHHDIGDDFRTVSEAAAVHIADL